MASQSYNMEIEKLYPEFKTFTHACPMWVPLVEYREANSPGADYFVKKDVEQLLAQSADIDTMILGCTHYPMLLDKISKYVRPESMCSARARLWPIRWPIICTGIPRWTRK